MSNSLTNFIIKKSIGHSWLKKKCICGMMKAKKPQSCNCIKPLHHLGDNLKEDHILISRFNWEGNFFSSMSIDDILTLISKNRNLYETLHHELPRKIYFDIDGYETPDILNDAKKIIKGVFGDDVDMAISGSVGMKRNKMYYSYHIVLTDIYFENLEDMKKSGFVQWVRMNKHIFDDCVYKKYQQVKLIGQSKSKSSRVQNIIEGDEIEDHIIQCIFDETLRCEINFNDLVKEEINEINKTLVNNNMRKIKNTSIIKIKRCCYPQPFLSIDYSEPLDILRAIPNDENYKVNNHLYKCIGTWFKREGGSFEQFYKWGSKPYGFNEEFKEQWLLYWDNDFQDTIKNKKVWSRYKIFTLLERFYGRIPNMRLEVFKTQFITEKGDISQGTKYIDSKQLQRIEDKYVCIKMNMGSGKTYAVVEWLIANGDKYPKMLWITSRITMANNLMHRLNGHNDPSKGLRSLDFKHYKLLGKGYDKISRQVNKRDAILNCKRLCCQLQSIHYCRNDYDVVIIDEIESVFNQFNSEDTHLNNYDNNYERFEEVLKCSKKVFFMDAFLHKRTLKYIEKLDHQKPILMTRANDKINKSVVYNKDFYCWFQKIIKDIREGKKLYIFYPYATGKTAKKSNRSILNISEKIISMSDLKKEDVLVYYGNMNGKDKQKLSDVNQLWKQARVIITNSCISVGVNYEFDDFDKIYLSYDDFLNPRDVIQSSFRIRNTKENVIEFYRFPNVNKIKALKSQTRYIPPVMKRPKTYSPSDAFEYMSQFLTEEYNAKGYEILKYYFGETGYNIDELVYNKCEEFKKEYKKANVDYDFLEYDEIEDIDNKKGKTLQRKQFNGTATATEIQQLNKYFYNRHFTKDAPDDVKKNYWNKEKMIENVKEIFINPILQKVITFDKTEIRFEINQNKINDNDLKEIVKYFSLSNDLETTINKFETSKRTFTIKNMIMKHFFGGEVVVMGKRCRINKILTYPIKMKGKFEENLMQLMKYHKKLRWFCKHKR